MKKTPLNEMHRRFGARLVDFAGWDMPVYYASGLSTEHMAVRTKCGIFDVSHMGEIEVRGPQAEAVVQKVTCNDASRLRPGQSHYSAFLTEKGTFVDDVIVNRLAADRFLICVNASNAEKDFAWMKPHATADTAVVDRSDEYFLIAVQGPEALGLIEKLWRIPPPPKPFTLIEAQAAGVPVIVSRTGYTGEDGVEIYGPWDRAPDVWEPLIEAGAAPCGLGARDTLRLEAALPLYGHEIDETIHPFEAGLGWIVKMDKGDFLGREALRKAVTTKKLVGIEMTEPGIARQGCAIYSGETPIGLITSGTKSPYLDKAVALGYVAADFAAPNTKIAIDIHRKTRHATIVPLPFYRRKKT